jgi:hypothetical protein
MSATFKYISQLTEQIFEARMQRAASKITERQYFFPVRAA